jgi:hypothetical protein
MSNKIDELFAPGRLRQTWQRTGRRPDGDHGAENDYVSPHSILMRMEALCRDHYSGDDNAVFNLLLDELRVILNIVLPDKGEGRALSDRQTEAIAALHQVLNRIEDIWEAFEAADRNREPSQTF